MWTPLNKKQKKYVQKNEGYCARCGGTNIVMTPHGYACAVDGGRIDFRITIFEDEDEEDVYYGGD